MLYHASSTAGLRVLQPRVSSHGKPYVYAMQSRAAALVFGAPQDDFDFLLEEEDGVLSLHECYPGALETKYAGRSCALYVLPEAGFLRGVTGWEPEWVCPAPVQPVEELAIPDLYRSLLAEQARGQLKLHRYRETPAYRAKMAEHLVDRLVRSDYWRRAGEDPRFQTHFAGLLALVRQAMSGRELPGEGPVLGRTVTVTVDRPLGSLHPRCPDIRYPVNYGYVAGTPAPDGEDQDVYILGVDQPVDFFTGRVIAVLHRKNDGEDKWVAAPPGWRCTPEQILQAVHFQEQYFEVELQFLPASCNS